ncbi:MAG TPA: hypothetical protein VJJ52_00590 [Candidatus Nanoarchaeia archaeon]|nr:hypothetical protein [Candidatus Nanoarchaeia archaeon]
MKNPGKFYDAVGNARTYVNYFFEMMKYTNSKDFPEWGSILYRVDSDRIHFSLFDKKRRGIMSGSNGLPVDGTIDDAVEKIARDNALFMNISNLSRELGEPLISLP